MSPADITIVTDQNPDLGSGHFQRMISLALVLAKRHRVTFVSSVLPLALDFAESIIFSRRLPGNSDLIVRDMRDSSADEIQILQKSGPVLVIDDHGPGRHCADSVLDLLPHPFHGNGYVPEFFLYGAVFTGSLKKLPSRQKRSGFGCYPGVLAADSAFRTLMNRVVEEYRLTVLGTAIEGVDADLTDNPAGLYCSAQGFICYFGIAMYEALLCRCSVLLVNPTDYHEQLAGRISDHRLINCGTVDSVTPETLIQTLNVISNMDSVPAAPRELFDYVQAEHEKTACHIMSLTGL